MNSVALMQRCHGMDFLKEAHQGAYKVIFGLGCQWHVSLQRNVIWGCSETSCCQLRLQIYAPKPGQTNPWLSWGQHHVQFWVYHQIKIWVLIQFTAHHFTSLVYKTHVYIYKMWGFFILGGRIRNPKGVCRKRLEVRTLINWLGWVSMY